MTKAMQLNSLAVWTNAMKNDEKIKETKDWIKFELYPYLEKLASEGQYDVILHRTHNYYTSGNKFEDINCPKCGLHFSILSEILRIEGSSVTELKTIYHISWKNIDIK